MWMDSEWMPVPAVPAVAERQPQMDAATDTDTDTGSQHRAAAAVAAQKN